MTTPINSSSGHSGSDENAQVAAKQLEAYFLRQILADMPSSGLMGGDGVAGSTFRGMFEEVLADTMADTGQLGVGASIAASLTKTGVGTTRSQDDLVESLSSLDVGKGMQGAYEDTQGLVDKTDAAIFEAKHSAVADDSITGVE